MIAKWILLAGSAWAADCRFEGLKKPVSQLEVVADRLSRPVKALQVDGSRWIVAEQEGRVVLIDGRSRRVILDLKDKVTSIGGPGDERGLLGMALHPGFAQNRRLFVSYTTSSGPQLTSRLSEFLWVGETVDLQAEKVILSVPQPYQNHNGGEVAFGHDGMLYWGLGDGGSANDPQNNSQNLKSLLGKILRIDVREWPYRIPTDNPFVGTGFKAEIYAYGLRNPWRFSFDRMKGDLWVGDVGQNQLEEIDLVTRGGNYGWKVMEGSRCAGCDPKAFVAPVFEYGRTEGYSVTGGFVYRGSKFPHLVGKYIFGDFGSGKVWAGDSRSGKFEMVLETGKRIASFAEDRSGELYLVDHAGALLRIVFSLDRNQQVIPSKLSTTGCFKALAPLVPADGVIGYQVTSPLWSDGTEKLRFVKLSSNSPLRYKNDGTFLPDEGMILIKNFSLPGHVEQVIETRFMVFRDQYWHAFTYLWEGDDARLLSNSETKSFALDDGSTFLHDYPSRSDCLKCHDPNAKSLLGFELDQLNGISGQVAALVRSGAVTESAISYERKIAPQTDPLFGARSWLHANCAHCHNGVNPAGLVDMDLRFWTPIDEMKALNHRPARGDLGLQNARIIAPGSIQSSVLHARISGNVARMPPIASRISDSSGVQSIADWITSLP